MPEISVILPVYNAADYLAEAIESILSQSYQNFELLLINDGSTDNSKNIINSYSDTRIRYFENDGNKGPSYTRNLGLIHSKGDYISFLDADDMALPNKLEQQLTFMKQHHEVGVCGCYAEYFGDRVGTWQYPVSNKEIRCRLMWGSSIIMSAAFIRKNTLANNNIQFSDKYLPTEDFKLWVEMSKVSQLHNIPEVLVKYRTHRQQITVTKEKLMNETKTKIILEQLSDAGVKLLENDFDIVFKFICYKYDYFIHELNRLLEIYVEFISLNNISQKLDSTIINRQIEERLFEACYFSTKQCGLKAVTIFKRYFNFNDILFMKQMKFYYKALKIGK
ncbi:MAG: glycosyltransferase family 2 protein [Bacteroidia bacterium]